MTVHPANSFAQRLSYLFEISGATYKEVVAGTKGAIKEVYLYQLRTGKAKNPSYKVIKALSEYFRVSPGYFFDGQTYSPEITDEIVSKLFAQMASIDEQKAYRMVFRSLLVNRIQYEQTSDNKT